MKAKDISRIEDEKLLILSTGSQGEQMAALARMARQEHTQVKIKPGDTIVFSSSPIPGNTLNVTEMINSLIRLGAIIKINKLDGVLHTSGHATIEEQKLMFALTKPKNFMPVHGEHRMQKEHGFTSIDCGVPSKNVFYCDNGESLTLKNKQVSYGPKLKAGIFYVDNNDFKIPKKMFIQRSLMSNAGVIGIFIILNKKDKTLITTPKIITKGFILVSENNELLKKIQKMAIYSIKKEINTSKKIIENNITRFIVYNVSKYIKMKLKRHPLVHPIIVANIVFIYCFLVLSFQQLNKKVAQK